MFQEKYFNLKYIQFTELQENNLHKQVTNSRGLSLPQEARSFLVSQEISRIL
jgi:hypothetical protein